MTTIEALPTPARDHSWHPKFTVPHGRSGAEETHRICKVCSMIKITVHAPHEYPYRMWETRFGERWRGDATPPCLADGLTPMCGEIG